MDGTVVCLAARLARLWGRGAVGEGHAVGGAVGLAVVAVLVVDHVLLWLAALDLNITNKKKHNAVTHLTQTAAAKKGLHTTRSKSAKARLSDGSEDYLARFPLCCEKCLRVILSSLI